MYSICRPWPIMLKMGRAPIYVVDISSQFTIVTPGLAYQFIAQFLINQTHGKQWRNHKMLHQLSNTYIIKVALYYAIYQLNMINDWSIFPLLSINRLGLVMNIVNLKTCMGKI